MTSTADLLRSRSGFFRSRHQSNAELRAAAVLRCEAAQAAFDSAARSAEEHLAISDIELFPEILVSVSHN